MNELTLSDIIYPELKTTSRLNYLKTNFHVWRFKLDFVLKDKQVNYVLTEPKPSENYENWVFDDFRARQIILQTLHEHLFISPEKHETAKSMMDALTMLFTKHSVAKKENFLRQYMNHRMKEGTDIKEHIVKMKAMAKELELEGVKMLEDKEFQSLALLESLPESWKDVVTSITQELTIDGEALDFENLCTKLIHAGDLKEFISSRDGSTGGFKGNCYSCGEFGHRKSDCPN